MHDCLNQWSREGTARKTGSRRPRGTPQMEYHRYWSIAGAHHAASAAEIRAAGGTTVIQRTLKSRLLQGQILARRPVACPLLTLTYTVFDVSGVKLELNGGQNGRLLFFLMKADFAYVPVMTVC